MRYLILVIGALALFAASCGDEESTTGPQPSTPTPTPTPTPAPDPTTPDPTTPDPTPTPATTRCVNPDGFALAYPSEWATNDGNVVEPCSQFDPEPFEVPDGTDERVAAVTAYVDPVPFYRAATPDTDVTSRATSEVGGHQAVRLETTAGDDSIYPPGTASTYYAVDLSVGVDDGTGTLFLHTVDTPGVDYTTAVETLDEMFRSLELTTAQTDPAAVARYEGAGTSITVTAETTADDTVCLTFAQADQTDCIATPAPDGVAFTDLGDGLSPVLAGIAGHDVFRVAVVDEDGDTTSFLPTEISGTDARGWAVPGSPDDVARIETFALDGSPLRTTSSDDAGASAGS